MRLIIPDLLPSTDYAVQVRTTDGASQSEWSEIFEFTTMVDTIKPIIPPAATWVSTGDSFHGEWNSVTTNVQGDTIAVVRYEVELIANGVTKTDSVVPATGNSKVTYDLSFEANRALFGSPQGTVAFRVRAVDNKELKSDWTTTISASNPAPTPPTAAVVTAGVDSLDIAWTASTDDDVAGYHVHVGTTAGFTPTTANRIYTGNSTRFTYTTTTYSTLHFKIRAVDKFNQASTDLSASGMPVSPFTVDVTAPNAPTGATVATSYNAARKEAYLDVSWTASSSTDVQNYTVRYGPASGGPWVYENVGKDSTTLRAVVTPGQVYHVAVRATDWSSNYSNWTNTGPASIVAGADTTPPATPTGLTVAVRGDGFIATWNNNTDNDLKEYQLGVNYSGGAEAFYTTTSNRFEFTYDMNTVAFGGTARPSVFFRVRAIDQGGMTSSFTSAITATNAAPPAPTALTGTTGANSITLGWAAPVSDDLVGYNVYQGTAANPTTKVGSVTGTSFTTTVNTTGQFFVVKSYDRFGTESAALAGGPFTATNPFIVDTVAPAVPSGLSATLTNNSNGVGAQANVSWTANTEPDLAGYKVRFRRGGAATEWSSVDVPKNLNIVRIDVPLAYVDYNFQVLAYDNSANISNWSTQVTATAQANTAPAVPTGLTSNAGRDSITYNWTPLADADLAKYEVTFSTSSTFASGNTTFDTGNSAQLVVGGLTPGTTYYARVRAVDNGGLASAFSATHSRATLAYNSASTDGLAPASSPAPSITAGVGYLFVTWSPVTNNDAVTYDVHLSTTNNFTPSAGTRVESTPATNIILERTVAGTELLYGTPYYVKIVARDADGSAAPSAQATGTPRKLAGGDSTLTNTDVGADPTGAASAAQTAAATDATTKANNAKAAAEAAAALDATAKANAAKAAAEAVAAADATAKAEAARANAVNTADANADAKIDTLYTGTVAPAIGAVDAKADNALDIAESERNSQFLNINQTFNDWTGIYPVGYSGWIGLPIKETSIKRTGKHALRFNAPDGANLGVQFSQSTNSMAASEYLVFEFDVMLLSGTFGGSGLVCDWVGGAATGRQYVNLNSIIDAGTIQAEKWYRVTRIVKRPSNASDSTAVGGYIMANYSSGLGTPVAKEIIFDRFGVRPASIEEITAYNAPGNLSGAVSTLSSEIGAVDTKANNAQTTANSKTRTFTQGTVPSATTIGDIWIDTANGNLIKIATALGTGGWTARQDSAISTAQTAANTAATAASTAQTAANNAATLAGTKGKVLIQSTAPVVGDQLAQNLWIDTTSNLNIAKRWSGSAWVAVQDKGIQDAATAAANAQTAANNAATAASNAATAAATAQTAADNAATAASTAQTTATNAGTAAANAAGIANSKAVVLYQSTAPAAEFRNALTLWIDTTGGANTPKRWTTGTTWVAVQDKTAVDAAAAAVAANTAASNAQTAANNAQTTADGKGRVYYQTVAPSSTNPYDLWVDITGNANTPKRWVSGTTWAPVSDKVATDAAAAAAAAQTAANNAMTAAQSNSRVYYQTTAPASTNSQDLWIDTTGNANTPKRWTGSIWQAVNDKVATDAAALAGTKGTVYFQATAPASTLAQDLWIDTTAAANTPKRYIGGVWQAVQDKTALDAAALASVANVTANAAVNSAFLNPNQTFANWSGGAPDGWNMLAGAANPTKETTLVRTSPNAVRVNVNNINQNYMDTAVTSFVSDYIVVELDVMLNGTGNTFAGSAMLVDWNQTSGLRSRVDLSPEITNPIVGKWYRITKVIKKPSDFVVTSYRAFIMANWAGAVGGLSAKDIIFDKFGMRPATAEEITAYEAPGNLSSAVTTLNNTISGVSDTANQALSTATGKNKVIFSTNVASGTSGYVAGDIWYRRDANNNVIAQWEYTGSAWAQRYLSDGVLSSLSVGKLTSGSITSTDITLGVNGFVRSTDFVAGSTGWRLGTGGLEINNGTIKGSVIQAGTLVVGQVSGLATDLANRPLATTVNSQVATAQSTAISTAAGDATTKANAARTNAVADLKTLWGHPTDTTLIDGGDIYTNSIKASSIALADFTNLVQNSDASDGMGGWSNPRPGATVAITTGGPGPTFLFPNGTNPRIDNGFAFEVKPGEKFKIKARVYNDAPQSITIGLRYTTADKAFHSFGDSLVPAVSTPAFVDYQHEVEIPPNVYYAQLTIAAATTLVGNIYIHRPSVYRMNAGELIVDGSIAANKVSAGTYTGGAFIVGTGGTVRSANYVAGVSGWTLDPAGLEINGGSIRIGAVSNLQTTLDAKETPTGAQAKATAAQTAAISTAATDATGKATAAQTAAINAAALDATAKANAAQALAVGQSVDSMWQNTNANFYNWTTGAAFPTGYTAWNGLPTRETTITRSGQSVRFNTAAANSGMTANGGAFNAMPYSEYVTIEVDAYLVSGTFSGANILLDWNGVTPGSRTTFDLHPLAPSPTLGKWYRFTKTFKRPGAGGTFSGYGGYIMANYSGALTAKDIIFDKVGLRAATEEEITAFNAPGNLTSGLATTLASAGTAADGKINTYNTGTVQPALATKLNTTLFTPVQTKVTNWTAADGTHINGGELFTGSVTTDSLAANAVTANKLNVIMGGGNLLPESQFGSNPLNLTVWGARSGRTDAVSSVSDESLGTPRALEIEIKSGMVNWPDVGGYKDTGVILNVRPQVPPGTAITCSAWVKRVSGTGPLSMGVQKFNAANAYIGGLGGTTFNASNTELGVWKRFIFTVISDALTDRIDTYFVMPDSAATIGDKWRVKNVQLEIGEVATSYAPKVDEILPGTISAPMMQANSITAENAAIADATITNAKIVNMQANKLTSDTLTSTIITLGAGGILKTNNSNVSITDQGIFVTGGSQITASALTTGTFASGQALTVNGNMLLNGNMQVQTGGYIKSTEYTGTNATTNPSALGWYLGRDGLHIDSGIITADAIRAGNLGGPAGTNSVINITTGTNIIVNGGYIKSNTYTGTTYATNPSGAGWYIGNDGIHVDSGAISATALVAGTISGTNTITLSGAGAKIVGTGFELSGAGLTVTNGTIAAAAISVTSAFADSVTATTTTIDGGKIKTGSLVSTSNTGIGGTPLWSIPLNGSATFQNMLVRGASVVGASGDNTNSYLSSFTYTTGSAGWRIWSDGNAEFNNVTVRGNLQGNSSSVITGGTITGGTLQTNTTNNSVIRINSTGIIARNAAGTQIFLVDGVTGNQTIGGTTTINGTTSLGGTLTVAGGISITGTAGSAYIRGGGMTGTTSAAATGNGFIMDVNGLYIGSGRIAAQSLLLQVPTPNLMPVHLADWAMPAAWYAGKLNSANATLSFDSNIKWTPNQSLKVVTAAAAPYVFLAANTSTYNTVRITPNQQYVVSFYYQLPSGTVASMNAKFRCQTATSFVDANGGPMIDTVTGTAGMVADGTWRRAYAVVTVPATATGWAAPFFDGITQSRTFYLDGLQVEEKVGGLNTPSSWNAPSSTLIDGGQIRTGVITSSVSGIGGEPVWSINMGGYAEFQGMKIRGDTVVGNSNSESSQVRSYNFVEGGSEGWRIEADGSSEFRSMVIDSLDGASIKANTLRAEAMESGVMSATLSLAGSFKTIGAPTDGVGTFALGATSITNVGGTITALTTDKGLPISGTGIQAGTIITAVSGTTYTISRPTTAAGTASDIQVYRGRSVTISGNDGILLKDQNDSPVVEIPTNPNSPVKITGSFTASDILVTDRFTMFGENNILGQGSRLTLNSGAYDAPAPALSYGYDTVEMTRGYPNVVHYAPNNPNEYSNDAIGAYYDHTNRRYYFASQFFGPQLNVLFAENDPAFNAEGYFERLVDMRNVFTNEYDLINSVSANASNFYFLTKNAATSGSGSEWRLQAVTRAGIAKVAGPVAGDSALSHTWLNWNSTDGLQGMPAHTISPDGKSYIAKVNDNGRLVIYKYAAIPINVGPSIAQLTTQVVTGNVASVMVGTFDGTGAKRIVVTMSGGSATTRNNYVFYENPAGTSISSSTQYNFEVPGNKNNIGTVYFGTSNNDSSGKFKSLSTDGYIANHTKFAHEVDGNAVSFRQRWRNSTDGRVGPLSPSGVAGLKRRAKVTLTSVREIPDVGGTSPNALTFHLGIGTTTQYRLPQMAAGIIQQVITDTPTSDSTGSTLALAEGAESKIVSNSGLEITGKGMVKTQNPIAKLVSASNQSLASSASTVSTVGMVNPGGNEGPRGNIQTNTNSITIQESGWYNVVANVAFGNVGTGTTRRYVKVEKADNATVGLGTKIAVSEQVGVPGVYAIVTATGVAWLNSGDVIRVGALQNSGATHTLSVGFSDLTVSMIA